jgi:RNA polymerase sigma-70 factor (ECF subfamily)
MPTEPRTEPESPTQARDPDQDLLDGVRRGDGASFEHLVRRHESRVHRLAWRILGDSEDALDAAQETFLKVWKALPRFEGGSRFSTWLTRIAINQCRNELRRRRTVKHTHPLSLDAPLDDSGATAAASVPGTTPEPWEAAREREVAKALRDSLGDLDGEGKEVLVLRDGEDLSYEEIAEILEIPIGTVRSRLHRARSELRRRMAPVLDERGPSPRASAEDRPSP